MKKKSQMRRFEDFIRTRSVLAYFDKNSKDHYQNKWMRYYFTLKLTGPEKNSLGVLRNACQDSKLVLYFNADKTIIISK